MSLKILLAAVAVSGLSGIVIGYFLRHLILLQRKSSIELKVKQLLVDTKEKAQAAIEEATKKAEAILGKAKDEERVATIQIRKLEEHVSRKEEILEKRRMEVENEDNQVKAKVDKIKKVQIQLKLLGEKRQKELERVAGMSEEEAKKELEKI